MTVGYNNLANYYTTIFTLRQHHQYRDEDILNWLPFERDVYLDMLLAYLEKEKLKNQ